MPIAFGVNPSKRTLCSRFIGTVTEAEIDRYVALLETDASVPNGMPHFVDCQHAALDGGTRAIAEGARYRAPLSVRFSVVAIVATSESATEVARDVQAIFAPASERCVICGTRDDAWRALTPIALTP